MLKKTLLILLTLISSALAGFAQEICNNGIDDDGDGLIDCYDPQCNGNPDCSDFFYGKPALSCTTNPTNPAFSLNTIWQSPMDVSTRSTMMVGDMDGDGTPEVVCHQSGVNELFILDGLTGALEVTVNCPAILDHADAIAIGDTDDDGLGEIYVVTSDAFLRCFENNGTAKVGFTPVNIGTTAESLPSIADFNYDGIPEIYINNAIYHSLTGALIATGVGSRGSNPGSNGAPSGLPIAADVLPDSYCPDCAGLELVCGNTVFAVNITAATITAIANSLPGALKDGFTCVADMDIDGQLDVIVTSNGTIYVWDPRTGLQLGNTFNIPNTGAGGRANIADYDNDGLPEIGVGGNSRYVVIDVDTATNALSQKWIKTIVDGSEHTTGSVFDFDCDGLAQVVYRDENNLFVWDGATGNVIASIPCGSATRSEFPTIVDVDGDGQVNIVCACATGNGGSAGKVKAFNSSTNQWVGSRKVMNQHAYCVVNVNDDLSIPIQQQNHALLPKLNGFLAQSAIFDVNWSTTCIPLANVTVEINSVIYCQKPDTVIVGLKICNIGSKVTTSPTNVSVYNGDPLSGGTLISLFPLASTILADSCSYDTVLVPFTGTSATFYVYVNDDGSSPAAAPATGFTECDSSNNSDFVLINKPVISLSVEGDTIICAGDTTTLSAAGATTYSWSPVLGLSAATGNVVKAKPLITTTYTITGIDSVSGCDNSTTITVTVNPKPVAIFGSTTVCEGTSTQFTDTSTTSSGTISAWVWDFGDGSLANTNQHPSYIYPGGGNYIVTLIVGNSFACADTATKSIQVYNRPAAGFSHNDVCFGDSIQFTDTSSVDMPASITSYLWAFGDGSPSGIIENPAHLYSTAGSYNVKLVATSNNACSDSVTIPVNAYDAPLTAFTFSNTCLADSAKLINTSVDPLMGNIANWQWNFGDGSPLNTTVWSPSHLYVAPGKYQVTLITYSSNLGCADTLKDSITVFHSPVGNFGITNVCLNMANSLFDSSSVVNGTVTGWSWNFGDSSPLSIVQDPNHIYSIPGTYSVSLVVTTGDGCEDNISKNIVVHALPDAQFSATNVCVGAPVQFNDLSTILPTDTLQSWIWDFDDSSPVSIGQTATHLYTAIGSYDIQLLVVSNFGCIDSINKTTVVNPNPVVNFSAFDTIGCSPLCVSFQNSSSIAGGTNVQYLWNFGDGSTPGNSQNVEHCYTNNSVFSPVSFTPTITVTSDSGCVTSGSKNNYITVYPNPNASFTVSPQTSTIVDPVISITDLSTGTDFWTWNFGDLQTSTVQDPPSHTYAAVGTYIITLITSTQYDCIDTAYQTIIIEPDFLFYIPNAFTPDGDGINDFFTGKGIYIKEFEMSIFDRWGNLIYRSDYISKPWDGKANKGTEIAQSDVYVYSIKVTDFKMDKHNYSGIVTLVR
jgi:gliding motility-associated-like protein